MEIREELQPLLQLWRCLQLEAAAVVWQMQQRLIVQVRELQLALLSMEVLDQTLAEATVEQVGVVLEMLDQEETLRARQRGQEELVAEEQVAQAEQLAAMATVQLH